MVTVCAWCQRYLGSKEPFSNPAVSHGICGPCQEREWPDDPAVLVVSRARAATMPLLHSLLRGAPGVAIVVDRRAGDRRGGPDPTNGDGAGRTMAATPRGDRRTSERRRSTALYVV
jgi:hypothetical protein